MHRACMFCRHNRDKNCITETERKFPKNNTWCSHREIFIREPHVDSCIHFEIIVPYSSKLSSSCHLCGENMFYNYLEKYHDSDMNKDVLICVWCADKMPKHLKDRFHPDSRYKRRGWF